MDGVTAQKTEHFKEISDASITTITVYRLSREYDYMCLHHRLVNNVHHVINGAFAQDDVISATETRCQQFG
jgi:hypothetical protein